MNSAARYEELRRVLDPAALMRDASQAAALTDYGDQGFVKPMRHLLDRAAREADFTADGLATYRDNMIRFLVNRLRAEDDFRRHPEILDENISDPIIIIGLPRSGTTKLQRMMAAAPGLQKPILWRLLNPAPFPDAEPGKPDPRRAAAGFADALDNKSDEFQAGHLMAPDDAEEEFVLFDFPFDESVPGFSMHLPFFSHEAWRAGASDREAYQYVKKLIQYLQWQDGGKQNRPWLLKAVIHVAHMDALLECFPKATLIHSHRDPRNCIPSIAKLMSAVWEMKVTSVDKQAAGQGFLQWGSAAIERYLEARARLNLDSRILDVQYEHVRDNPLPIIRDIYRHAGLELTADAEQKMLEWERNNEQGKHGKHVYSLAEFGLSEAMIDQTFAAYIDRFIDR